MKILDSPGGDEDPALGFRRRHPDVQRTVATGAVDASRGRECYTFKLYARSLFSFVFGRLSKRTPFGR